MRACGRGHINVVDVCELVVYSQQMKTKYLLYLFDYYKLYFR